VTPEDRARLVREHGYREPIRDWHGALIIGAITLSLVGFGVFGALLGPDAAYRLRGVVMLVVGVGPAIWAWRYLSRPVAPKDDTDFERELRMREDKKQQPS
jgi:Na+/melibiose symporter-like transporter